MIVVLRIKTDEQDIRALRWLLKALLRTFKMRVLSIDVEGAHDPLRDPLRNR